MDGSDGKRRYLNSAKAVDNVTFFPNPYFVGIFSSSASPVAQIRLRAEFWNSNIMLDYKSAVNSSVDQMTREHIEAMRAIKHLAQHREAEAAAPRHQPAQPERCGV
jgi:hypothetical protein